VAARPRSRRGTARPRSFRRPWPACAAAARRSPRPASHHPAGARGWSGPALARSRARPARRRPPGRGGWSSCPGRRALVGKCLARAPTTWCTWAREMPAPVSKPASVSSDLATSTRSAVGSGVVAAAAGEADAPLDHAAASSTQRPSAEPAMTPLHVPIASPRQRRPDGSGDRVGSTSPRRAAAGADRRAAARTRTCSCTFSPAGLRHDVRGGLPRGARRADRSFRPAGCRLAPPPL
jgi:hypothetical protein